MLYKTPSINVLDKQTLSGSEKWLKRLNQIINNCFSDGSVSNLRIAESLDISERHLFRKVNELTGLSPKKYLRKFRLKKANELLKSGRYTSVKETAYAVGYSNVSYFIKQFEIEYGVTPLQMLKAAGWR